MRGHHVAYTLAFLPARHRLARASLNAHCGAGGFAWRAADGELYGRSIALLRPCRERPRSRSAAEQSDELAPLYVPLAAHSHCFTEWRRLLLHVTPHGHLGGPASINIA